MADIINPSSTGMTHNADVYWHYAGDPVQRSQLLGTFTIGAPQKVLLPIPADADIVLRCVPRGGRGQGFMAGPGDAAPHTISALGVGSGGGTSNFYQQLRVNHGYSYGTTPTPRPALNLLQSFQIKDDSVFGESDLTTFGVPTGQLNLKTDFNASGQIAVTTATAGTGSDIILATTLELQPGQGIFVKGAGVSGSNLVTTCLAVSADGKTITLNAGPFTAGPYTIVQADDTAAVQGWLNAKGDLAMPPGYYRLTSSITMPTTSEGFSIVIHGSGWDQSEFVFQHGGDGFIPTGDLRIDSVVFCDLTVATGTIGDTSGTIDAASRGIGVRWTSPGYTGIYDNFVMQRCRVIGWGRWGLWSDNLEVSWISQCIFRENKSGHVAFVGPDTISPNKQPNANTITDTTFDQAISAGPSDAKRTFSGSMTAGSRTLSGSGFTANDRGKFVIVHGAATIGGDLYSFIDTFNSSSSVTLAHQAQVSASGTVELFPVNVASILLNRANDTVLDGSTIQGNFADAGSGATNVASDVNAIKAYNSANCRFIGIHEEDNAGPGGAAIRMENCIAMTIENWGGASAGPPNFDNAHGADFQLINSHCVSVKNSFFNDRPQFVIDSSSSEVQIDDSLIVGYINLWQQDNSWDKLRVGSGVRVYQAADPRTNQVAGNEYLYDSLFGRDLITNGRFLDGSGGLEGWTTLQPTWWSVVTTSQTRGGRYLSVDATAQASNTTPTKIFSQLVPIPDTTPPGLFTLGFDWNLDFQNGVETTGYYVEVRLHPSSGIDEVCQFSTRRFSTVQDIWQQNQIRCFLGSGTSRTIDVQINVTPGSNNVAIKFGNFRLAAGKHVFGAWERGVHDFGGRMHAPLEFAPISTTGTGSTSPPPVGATYMSMVQDAGTLKLGYNGVWTNIGTSSSSSGVAAGTPNFFTIYNSSGTNIVDAPMDVEFGWVHFRTGGWLNPTQPFFSNYPSGYDAKFLLLDTDDVVYLGPDHDTAGGSTGSNVTIRAGRGSSAGTTAYKSTLQINGASGLFTLNNNRSANTTDTLRVTLPDLSMDGVVVQQPPGTSGMLYLGHPFAYRDLAGSATFFSIDHNGGIDFINSRQYTWPSTTPVVSGGLPMVLAYSSQATANNPVTLAWIPMSGGSGGVSGSGTVNFLPKYTGASSPTSIVGDSGFSDDGNITQVIGNIFIIKHRASVDDYSDVAWQTSTGGNFAIWRYDHRSGALADPSNTDGEMALYINDNTPRIMFGRHSSYFSMGLRVRPGTGGAPIFTGENSSGTAIFRVDLNGNLGLIQSLGYTWPVTTPVVTGGLPMVLAYTAQTVANQPVTLSWIQMTGGSGGGGITTIGPNVANVLPKWSSSPGVSVRDSGISDDGSTVISLANLFAIRSRANDFIDLYYQGISGTNQAIWRYQHSSASLADASANSPSGWGEMQLFFQSQISPSFFVGNAHSWFQSALRVRPFSGYSADLYSFECWAPGGSSANFRVKTDGDLSMIKSVSYIWPGSPAAVAGYVLSMSNIGTGQLAWVPQSTGSGVTWNSGTAAPLTNVLTKWTPGSAPYTIQNSSITDSGIQVTVANPFKVSISGTDKFTVSNVGAVFAAGGTRFGVNNIQLGTGTSYTMTATDRELLVDTASTTNQTIFLPVVSTCRGQIFDIVGLRQIQAILDPGAATGHANLITITTQSPDVINAWSGSNGLSWQMTPTNNYKAVRLIADATLNIWWLIPYYI